MEFLVFFKQSGMPAYCLNYSKKSPLRFREIKRELPEISNVVLTSALRALEELKLVDRVQFNEIPPHVEYSLTERKAMLPIFYEMIVWEKEYIN